MSYNDGNHCMEFHAKIYTVNGRDRSRKGFADNTFFSKIDISYFVHA